MCVSDLGQGQVVGSAERGNEASLSRGGGTFLE
jgi:hypothetical protein